MKRLETDANNARPEHSRAIVFLLLAALLWSTGGLFIKWVDWNGMAISGVRSLISALVIGVAFRKDLKITWSATQLLCAVAYALTVSLFVVANKLTTAANAIPMLDFFYQKPQLLQSESLAHHNSRIHRP